MTGAVLEAALEWQGYRIAFFTDDISFEDMLRIYMFDANMALVDAAVLGAMYSTGIYAAMCRSRRRHRGSGAMNIITWIFYYPASRSVSIVWGG
ncbi:MULTISPECIES: hypothetical protein [unclassified Duganella]|uniref:hypothetical protein n=1 Tax=unclassified Duganella TaxID=2636909 RepID=UPI001314A8E2|nr:MULTISPECIES: hypothetical protein [unclassified Duganella]